MEAGVSAPEAASGDVIQEHFMEGTLGFQREEWSVGEDRSLVTYTGHGLRVAVPPELSNKRALILAVIQTARRDGSEGRAKAIREALGTRI